MPRKRPRPVNGEAHEVADPFPDRTGSQSPESPSEIPFTGKARQIRPVLTLFAAPSAFILRLEDVTYTPIALAVARGIKSGLLTVITPTDTKVFDLGRQEPPGIETVTAQNPAPVLLSPDIPDDLREYVQGEEDDEGLPPIVEPEFQEGRVRHRDHTPPPPNSICGRCHGQGVIAGGGGCPVCQGRGTIIAWGRGRSQ